MCLNAHPLLRRDPVGEQRVENGRGDAVGELSGVGAAVEKEAEILFPQTGKAVFRLVQAFLQRGDRVLAADFACKGNQAARIENVEPRQAHILELHAMGIGVKGNIVVHRGVVQTGFQCSAEALVDAIALPEVAKARLVRVAAPAQRAVRLHAVRGEPFVPLQQERKEEFHDPLFSVNAVGFQQHGAAHGRLGAIFALDARTVGKVGNKSRLCAAERDLDQVGIG